MRRIDPWIQAGDDEQAQGGEDDRPLVTAGGGERAVALERGIDVGRGHEFSSFADRFDA